MNVFLLSRNHEDRARYHCDVHVNKLLLEAAQLLNTALHENGADDEYVFYQPTHVNHPWTQWATDRYANWEWLFDHMTVLGDEFLRRSDADSHATIDKVGEYWLRPRLDTRSKRRRRLAHYFDDDGERTEFPQTMPDEYVNQNDPVTAYRDYYVAEKVPEDWCTWSNGIPEWVLERQ